MSDPLSTPSSLPTPIPTPYDSPAAKPSLVARSTFNTSPRFFRGYFREAQLFKDSARKIGQLNNRLQPVVTTEGGPNLPLAQDLVEKQIGQAQLQLSRRQKREKVTQYFN